MTKILWDQSGQKRYETGCDHGVLYLANTSGAYVNGYAWNGLTTVTQSPSGAESNKQYADNIVYATLLSAEEFGGTIEAFTFPEAFTRCDGTATPEAGVGVYIGQQARIPFGFSYRTVLGNDTQANAYGYKLHLVYGAIASPSEKTNTTINDSPELVNFSWDFTTTPIAVGTIGGVEYKPTSYMQIDSTKVTAGALASLEDFLYGTAGTDPSLPTPAEVVALFAGSVTSVTPGTPTYNSSTDIITIPSTIGVQYSVFGVDVDAGSFGPISASVMVTSRPKAGYKFPAVVADEWVITFA